jgi:UDP-N-acetylmuramate: L-alanyl-gamma-D-glutamyl-meso-diaminopimelate ligase
MAQAFGVDLKTSIKALTSFNGLRRRQEFIGEARGIRIYDDFAHHPTAIESTIEAFAPLAKERKGRLWAYFEPRSNTLRRKVFQDSLSRAFLQADVIVLAPVYQKPDGLPQDEIMDIGEVAKNLKAAGKEVYLASSYEDILDYSSKHLKERDLALFMSNGRFGNLPRRLQGCLK